jgi:hypothetical protein
MLLTSGCNVIGAVAAKMGPPPKIPAQYVPADVPTVVIVENYNNPSSLRIESDSLARLVVEQLTNNHVAPIIDVEKTETLRQAKGDAYRKMPLDAIGRELGASQVIYVDLDNFDIDHALASEMLTGKAEVRVRVVDDAGELKWPIDSAKGYPISVKLNPKRVPIGSGDQTIRQELRTTLADKIAKLFYTWTSEDTDEGAHQFEE